MILSSYELLIDDCKVGKVANVRARTRSRPFLSFLHRGNCPLFGLKVDMCIFYSYRTCLPFNSCQKKAEGAESTRIERSRLYLALFFFVLPFMIILLLVFSCPSEFRIVLHSQSILSPSSHHQPFSIGPFN